MTLGLDAFSDWNFKLGAGYSCFSYSPTAPDGAGGILNSIGGLMTLVLTLQC